MALARTVWFSFHLGSHRSAVSLSALNVSPLTQLPWCGDQTPASVPPPSKGRSRPTNTPVFSPSSFVLPSFAWVYMFLSACRSGPPVCSQLVFCTHFCVWRCVPDVSMERNVLHVQLLLRHLVFLLYIFFDDISSKVWEMSCCQGSGEWQDGQVEYKSIFRTVKQLVCHYKCLYIYHYTFVKIHKMHNTKSARMSSMDLGDNDVSMWIHKS